MQRSHAVYRKTAHHAEVSHAHLFVEHHCQLRPYRFIARPGFLDPLFEAVVDLGDDLHMARQQGFNQLLVPALQRLWHQGVVGVGEGLAGDRPGVVPAQLMLVDQHTQQFRNGDGWVGVVQLDHFVIRQLRQFAARLVVATENVGHGAGALEVLLHQAQLFARQMVVVRVENLGQLVGVDPLLLGTQEIAVVEFGQVERMGMGRLPQTQRLRHAVTVAQHRQIPGLAGDGEARLPLARFGHFTANTHLHIQRFVVAEPRVAATMPVIRGFHLLAVGKGLTEQAVLIVQTIADRRLAYRRHGVQEAGRQTPQAAVAKRRVDLLFQQVGQVNVVRVQHIAHLLIPAQVKQIVAGQTANQEFH